MSQTQSKKEDTPMIRTRTFAGSMMLVCAALLVSAVAASAEMVITTRDGKRLTVPVNARDVVRIEYLETGPADLPGDRLRERKHRGSVRYLGCFRDQGGEGTAGRDLSGLAVEDNGMTTERCVSLCSDRDFPYAGTQYGRWCFCGNHYGRSGKAVNCNTPCAGNPDEVCGGDWANSVYEIR